MPYPSSVTFPSDHIFPGLDEDFPPLVWDDPDERYYHTGTDRGVLYLEEGPYVWNGITGVSQAGQGQASVLYRDGNIYFADVEPGDFTGTLTAFFWPDEFSRALGIPEIAPGLYANYQRPRRFGLSYRTLIGSGTEGDMFGYQIHLVYNALASIGSRQSKTLSNQTTLEEFSFELTAIPVKLRGIRPTAHFIIDTRNMPPETLILMEGILYGGPQGPGRLPDLAELYDIFSYGEGITFTMTSESTWRAEGSSAYIVDHGDGTWEIKNVNGVDNGDGTYTLSDTP